MKVIRNKQITRNKIFILVTCKISKMNLCNKINIDVWSYVTRDLLWLYYNKGVMRLGSYKSQCKGANISKQMGAGKVRFHVYSHSFLGKHGKLDKTQMLHL